MWDWNFTGITNLVQGFMSNNKSLTLIEQPEIHLHPKMQADLADLFIDILKLAADKKGKVKKFINRNA